MPGRRLMLMMGVLLLTSTASAQTTMKALVEEYAGGHAFSGTILVQKGDEVVYTGSFGRASLRFDVPNTVDTRYRIASITKLFTSVLLLQLQDQGLLDVDRTIRTYLPDYKGPAADAVTLAQLLNHTSGIDNMDKVTSAEQAIRDGIPAYQLPHSSDDLLAMFASGPLVHAPGSTFDYNNADYIVLGKIIERVTGGSYEKALQERILTPLRLADTGMAHQHDLSPGLADTYFLRSDLGRLVPDLPSYPENWYAAGGMYSTVRDLRVFASALFEGTLLKKDTLARLTRPGLDDYGFGVWSYEVRIGGEKYHAVKRPGQIMGAQTQLYRLVEPRVTVVILSNTGTTDLDAMVAKIGAHAAARR